MTLRQREYCHNCRQDVIYEFEDTTLKQVIICPNCGHEHYREIDAGTLINIRVRQGQREIHIAKLETPIMFSMDESQLSLDKPVKFKVERKEVIGTVNGCAVVKDKNGKRPVITNRRWGRDPRQ